MAKPKFQSEHDDYFGSPGLVCEDHDPITGEILPPRTKQADKDGCDIHNILRRIEQGGNLLELIKSNPQYGDFSTVQDFRTSMETVFKAQEQFEALPAAVRDRFDNNPEKFLAFVHDPKNGKELVDMGLATPRSPKVEVPASTTPAKANGAESPPEKA